MAKPTCTFCGQYEGVLMDTNLDDGDTQVICGNDLVMYVLTMTASLTVGMTKEQAEAYAELLDAIYANDPRGPKPPAKGAAKRRAGHSPPGDSGPDGAVAGGVAAQVSQPDSDVAADGSEVNPDGSVTLLSPCAQCGRTTAHGDAEKLTCDGCDAVLATVADLTG